MAARTERQFDAIAERRKAREVQVRRGPSTAKVFGCSSPTCQAALERAKARIEAAGSPDLPRRGRTRPFPASQIVVRRERVGAARCPHCGARFRVRARESA